MVFGPAVISTRESETAKAGFEDVMEAGRLASGGLGIKERRMGRRRLYWGRNLNETK